MNIAIASGKGGAGKTTIALSLAALAAERGLSVAYLDCDVEEPNGHLFLRPTLTRRQPVELPVPQINEKACRAAGVCGRCGQACQFSAIVCLGDVVVVNADLCHGCGACVLACPADALREVPHRTGWVESGQAGDIRFVHGLMDVGRVMATPVVRSVKRLAPSEGLILKDAPPGTACPTVETIRGSDLILLVAEATPFGFHDFTLAVQMAQALKLPVAAVINRVEVSAGDIRDWCAQQHIPVLAEIAADRDVAEAYARGQMPVQTVPSFRDSIRSLLSGLLRWVPGERQA